MRHIDSMGRQIATLLVFLLTACIAGCGSGSVKWKEEVQLSDGRIIVVERELILEAGGDEWSANRSGSKPKENRIRFTLPGELSNTVEWHSTKIDIQTWPEIPLVLDVESEQFVVFSSVSDPRGCHIYSKYHYRNNTWIEERLPSVFEKRSTNLFIFRNKDKQKFIDLDTKRKNIADVRSRSFRQIGPTNPDCSHL